MQRSDTILLITSTIAPTPGALDLKVTDPASRLAEYCAALEFYLGLLDRNVVSRIVYADNSRYPLDDLRAIVAARGLGARVEFLSFGSDADPRYGRYYLEMNLIDTAMRISEVLDTGKDQVIWKVTGRYVVQNIARIIAAAPADFDLYVNCRNRPIRFLDFYLAAFRSQSYPQILGRDIEGFRDMKVPGEVLLRQKINAGAFPGTTIRRRFRVTPRLTAGRRGYDGASYSGGKETVKYLLRRVANTVTPWIWI